MPFVVRTAVRHHEDLTAAPWSTAEGLGDVDTACAITGGIVGAATGVHGARASGCSAGRQCPAAEPSLVNLGSSITLSIE
ncbi:hypothetical protein [Streptomyces sp. NPDC002889]|uniref:hypothetical protein n=1 Tax=Streptomyces sp. NPDC002889 TaxID=3364669 RepID=UPI0036C7C206